jgi:hypothetical protein
VSIDIRLESRRGDLQAVLFLAQPVSEGIKTADIVLQILDLRRGGLPGTRGQIAAELGHQRRIRAVGFGTLQLAFGIAMNADWANDADAVALLMKPNRNRVAIDAGRF